MQTLNPRHLDAVIEIINKGPFFQHLAMRVTELCVGHATVIARISRSSMNPFGGVHGGVYSSALDTAAYWSAYCDLAEDQGLVTIDLKVDLLVPIAGEQVVVTGKRIKAGRILFLTEARMNGAEGELLAQATSKLLVTQNMQIMADVVNYLESESLPTKFIRSAYAV